MEGAVEFRKKRLLLNVPSDIIYQIFLRLPGESLLKLRSVCKLWICMMENDKFMDSYRQFRSNTQTGGGFKVLELDAYTRANLLIVDAEEDSTEKSIIKRIQLPKEIQPTLGMLASVQCVEGLVSIKNFILNPSTKETIKLPDPNENYYGYGGPNYSFQRRGDKNLYCLGFDAHSKTYKVLTFPLISTVGTSQVLLIGRILTLGITNSWRDVEIDTLKLGLTNSILIHTYLSVDNKIFFLIINKSEGGKSLLVFGIDEEKFLGMLQGQELPWKNLGANFMALEVNGKLGIMDELRNLWILENYNSNGGKSTWIKRNIVIPENLSLSRPIGTIHSNSEILFKAIIPAHRHPMKSISYVFYDPVTNNVRVGNTTNNREVPITKYVETIYRLKPATRTYRSRFGFAAMN